jgi:hypothetical protein
MARFYEGQRARIEAGELKIDNRFLRSVDGRLGYIDFFDKDENTIYFLMDDNLPIYSQATGDYYLSNFVELPPETVRPLLGEIDDHIFGLKEDLI